VKAVLSKVRKEALQKMPTTLVIPDRCVDCHSDLGDSANTLVLSYPPSFLGPHTTLLSLKTRLNLIFPSDDHLNPSDCNWYNSYGLVLLVSASTVFLTAWQSQVVSMHRKRAGVKYPQAYAEAEHVAKSEAALKFNCAQRMLASSLGLV
jgi:hypothetical protein